MGRYGANAPRLRLRRPSLPGELNERPCSSPGGRLSALSLAQQHGPGSGSTPQSWIWGLQRLFRRYCARRRQNPLSRWSSCANSLSPISRFPTSPSPPSRRTACSRRQRPHHAGSWRHTQRALLDGRFRYCNSHPPHSGTPADHLIEVTTHNQVFRACAKRARLTSASRESAFAHAGNAYPSRYGPSLDPRRHHYFEIIEATGIFECQRRRPRHEAMMLAATICSRRWLQQIGRSSAATSFATAASKASPVLSGWVNFIEDNLIEWWRLPMPNGAELPAPSSIALRHSRVPPQRRSPQQPPGIWPTEPRQPPHQQQHLRRHLDDYSTAVSELNLAPVQIDNNIIRDVRNAEPGTPGQYGCAGSGVFTTTNDHLIVAQIHRPLPQLRHLHHHSASTAATAGTSIGNNVANNIIAQYGPASCTSTLTTRPTALLCVDG